MEKFYTEHKGKVIETDDKFKLVMAITLDSRSENKRGIIRCVVNREGDLNVKGYTDRSELHLLSGESLENFKIGERLNIKNEKEILDNLIGDDGDFIGLEDPDIWIDRETSLMHVYFTIPIKYKDKSKKTKIHLGHAVGKDLDSLEMTEPVLLNNSVNSAKEVSIAPINSKGCRYNLIESRDRQPEATYSIVKFAIAKDMGKSWEYGNTVFHPKEHSISWIGGHASPAPLLSKKFIDVGEGKLLGFINGREANQKMSDGVIKYGMFSVGLFIYDYENGKIDWVSPEPFIQDSEATTITFASQFVETSTEEGILYAHVDDSFVRAYSITVSGIKSFLKKFSI
ncbi:MAG: hypothetical protein QG583_734 [Patescibacteria group bacterium]|nr:hypothetical protein [Patescibacteria group bacterium]